MPRALPRAGGNKRRGHCIVPPIFSGLEKRTEAGIHNLLLLCPPPLKFFGPSAEPATLPPLFSGYLSFDDYRNTRCICTTLCQSRYVGLFSMDRNTDYGRPERKKPSLNGRKFTPTPKFLGTAKAYSVCHFGPIFQISLIYAFIGCP